MTNLEVYSCTVGKWKTNSYLIVCDKNLILIDPGDDSDKLEFDFKQLQLDNANIIIFATHGHFDHVGAVDFFKRKYNCKFGIHSKDKRILGQANLFRKITGDVTFQLIPKIDLYLDDIEFHLLCDHKIYVHHIPGHSEGSVAFEIENYLFTGDLILENELGRVDLPGGDKLKLLLSIRYIINNFIGFTIFPGHGRPFELSQEKIDLIKSQLKKWESI